MRVHAPADDPATEEILRRGEVQPPLAGPDLLDVRAPHVIGLAGPEVPADQVGERLNAGHPDRAPLAPPAVRALEARQTHETLHALLADVDAFAGQHRVHARAAVPASAVLIDAADLLGQPRVGELPVRRRARTPRPIAGLGNPEQLAHQGDRVGAVGSLRRDMPVDTHRVSVSLANRAVARLRMSRSCSKRLQRLRNSRNSPRSALVSPSSRAPAVALVLTLPVPKRLRGDPEALRDIRDRATLTY